MATSAGTAIAESSGVASVFIFAWTEARNGKNGRQFAFEARP